MVISFSGIKSGMFASVGDCSSETYLWGQNIQVSIVYPYLLPLPHVLYRYSLDLG